MKEPHVTTYPSRIQISANTSYHLHSLATYLLYYPSYIFCSNRAEKLVREVPSLTCIVKIKMYPNETNKWLVLKLIIII